MKIAKSNAALTLSRCSLSQAQIGRRLNVSKTAVAGWQSGLKKPAPEKRKLLESFLGIPVGDWDVDANPEIVRIAYPQKNNSRAKEITGDLASHTQRLHALLRDCFEELEADAGMPVVDKVETIGRAATAVATLEKIEKNAWEAWRKSPECKRFTEALRTGLQGFPEAAASVMRALDMLHAEVRGSPETEASETV